MNPLNIIQIPVAASRQSAANLSLVANKCGALPRRLYARPVVQKSPWIGALMAVLVVSSVALAQQPAKEITLKTMPPSVVKTVPQAGDTAVDPELKEITVTFSKDMKTNRMWAVCQISKETYPETAGQIHYLPDQRTCVVPVKLERGKTYALWFNRGQFNSFRDTENNPSVPYQLVFQTRK